MQALAIGALAGGTILSAYGKHQEGQAASRAATINANQMETAAGQFDTAASQQEGASQLQAAEQKRQARYLQSRAIALAAANGGDTSEKNINDIITGIEGEGEYRALMNLYNGKIAGNELRMKATGLRNQATMTRYEGRQARRAGNAAAVGSSLLGVGQMGTTFASKYGSYGGSSNSFNSAGNSGLSNTNLNVNYPSTPRYN